MNAVMKSLADADARLLAMTAHDRSLLVEAGAGSGKTAVMAGRVALMLANGITPKSIAAVTFTEFAASELVGRVREFVADLAHGHVPTALRIAFPAGVLTEQKAHLAAALDAIDEITCSTIHGFCQRLIKPYPVEANIDPGAKIADRNEADLLFSEILEAWLRERLSTGESGIVAEMVLAGPGATLDLVHTVVSASRTRKISAPAARPLPPLAAGFLAAAQAFNRFITREAGVDEPETGKFAAGFGELATIVSAASAKLDAAALVQLLVSRPSADLVTTAGTFRVFRHRGKWVAAARINGLAKSDGERLADRATALYEACCSAWGALSENIAAAIISVMIEETRPVIERYQQRKREAALLDFDDLIQSASRLLRENDDVRRALAARYSHVLVDEFQDTDPLQAEIFWRMCGEPTAPSDSDDWRAFTIRPGALFLVADPKQAIYRFRGADVAAYLDARQAFLDRDPESVLTISTNFRSCEPILGYVNEHFAAPLSSERGQPGFTALEAFHDRRDDAPCVVALDVSAADEEGHTSADRQRDAEADAIADMCSRLIGSYLVTDRETGERRPCRPGDIALLAPTGTDLWRYEAALEAKGIPVATQAGKGFYRRQEIQDLVALTRTISDRRDTLALGALLRGPLVGLTEEELLDVTWALRDPAQPERLPVLDLGVDPSRIDHPLAREVIEKLQTLARRARSTTPHLLLSQAIDALRIRPILTERHRNQAERALANVDLYLSYASAFEVRGLHAFAEAMSIAWEEAERTVEGRPDAQEEAVGVITMHAAKGLEWPIVAPINTMTAIKSADSVIVDRQTGTLYCSVFGKQPAGYDDARNAEKAELERERIRLWYVAATRARDLLVLPRLDVELSKSAWASLMDLSIGALPPLDLSALPPVASGVVQAALNHQTREAFAHEAGTIASRQRTLAWHAPSRDEGVREVMNGAIWTDDTADAPATVTILGGRERGLILHKLLEEVLTGETADDAAALSTRATELIADFGLTPVDDPAAGLSPSELSGCVVRALALPAIAELRATLVPELPVYGTVANDNGEDVTTGAVDAAAFDATGRARIVVDWKSDVAPTADIVAHYHDQVSSYLELIGAERGLIVFLTSGRIVEVVRKLEHVLAAVA